MFEISCNGHGMLSIGNRNPLNNKVGKNKLNSDVNMADCWVEEALEINMPVASAVIVNKMLSTSSKARLPFIGTRST